MMKLQKIKKQLFNMKLVAVNLKLTGLKQRWLTVKNLILQVENPKLKCVRGSIVGKGSMSRKWKTISASVSRDT